MVIGVSSIGTFAKLRRTADTRRSVHKQMNKLKPFIPSVIAAVAAVLTSLFLIEETRVIISCLAVGAVSLMLTVVVSIGRSVQGKRSLWHGMLSTLIPGILFIGIASSHVPLRIAFRVYRARFDLVAARIETGNPPATPFWIGPFKIKMLGRRGVPAIPYLGSNEDQWEIEGFVRHPGGGGFNIWSCITLDDKWSYIAED